MWWRKSRFLFLDAAAHAPLSPTVAIMQWRNEIEAHTDPNLKVLVWHGYSRESDVKELKKYDVVSCLFHGGPLDSFDAKG